MSRTKTNRPRPAPPTPRAIELFAGAGGLGMGVSLAGFQTQSVIELDRYCCDTIRENQQRRHPLVSSWPLVEGDARAIDFANFQDKIDLVSGGPPCQPFSLGGKHRAHDDKRDLFPEAVRAVRQVRPRAFIFENVKGLTRQSFANYYEYIYLQLSYPELTIRRTETWPDHLARLEQHHTSKRDNGHLSYQVVRRVLNAADHGVSQRRERVFFVGFRSDLGLEWSFPEPTHSFDSLVWEQVITGRYWERHRVPVRERVISDRALARAKHLHQQPRTQPWRTVRDVLHDLPDPQSPQATAFLNHRFQDGARAYPGHTGSPLDEPAKTLKAGVHGVPGGENMLVLPDGNLRYFTVRESARLQTFPDDYQFHGSWTETMRQLGNAVPVQLAAHVARNVRAHLDANGARA